MIDYSYNIIKVDNTSKVMEIVYTAPGRATMHISARLPYEGESLESIVQMYSPVAYWLEQSMPIVDVVEGTSGQITNTVSIAPPTLNDVKIAKLAELASSRYNAETSGIVLDGNKIRTDRESQATLTGAYVTLQAGFTTSIDWKTSSGEWITLTLQEVEALASLVSSHVQACFATERALSALVISANTIEEVNSITWPS